MAKLKKSIVSDSMHQTGHKYILAKIARFFKSNTLYDYTVKYSYKKYTESHVHVADS